MSATTIWTALGGYYAGATTYFFAVGWLYLKSNEAAIMMEAFDLAILDPKAALVGSVWSAPPARRLAGLAAVSCLAHRGWPLPRLPSGRYWRGLRGSDGQRPGRSKSRGGSGFEDVQPKGNKPMKTLLFATAALTLATAAQAQDSHFVNGYTRADGAYVAPHYQTNPDATRNNNWSTLGNVNPYTGQEGTRPPDGQSGYGYAPPRGQSSFGQPAPGSLSAHPYNNSSFGNGGPDPYPH